MTAPHFAVGTIYDRWPDINNPYGGSRQSGISACRQTKAIFLFTGESRGQYGYKDHFDERGVFWYTGEGQVGDMQLDKGNYAIASHASEGRALLSGRLEDEIDKQNSNEVRTLAEEGALALASLHPTEQSGTEYAYRSVYKRSQANLRG